MFGERNAALLLDELFRLKSIVEAILDFLESILDPFLFIDTSLSEVSDDLGLEVWGLFFLSSDFDIRVDLLILLE